MTVSSADDGLLSYRIDWLQMLEPPSADPVPCPAGEFAELVEAADFPVWYFFAMYDAVGDGYVWEDMHLADPRDVEAFVGSAGTRMHTLMRHGWPQGFFVLDFRTDGVCNLAYFGLVKQAIGRGLGGWLLDRAVALGWAGPGVRRLTVNTCTLDHPRAMPLYKGRAFELVRSETRTRPRRKPAARHYRKDTLC